MTRTLMITGANRGLGHAIAARFVTEGWRVAMLNRTPGGPGTALDIRCDLRDPAQLADAFHRALEHLGRLDVCVANAAVRTFDSVTHMTAEAWDDAVAVNLSGAFRLAQLAIPVLRDSNGHLVFVGSQAATHPFEGGGAYCATKAALKALHEVIVLENGESGMRCSLLSAGAIRNRPMANDGWKIRPDHVAQVLWDIVGLEAGAFVGEVEVRPTRPLPAPVTGIARLQTL
ncbi:SDR family NAD(P)-dependent oxidoreductase [Roseospira marina]|uniref:SDR family NAD(P)-dependent oxidoreductase n=1 Tax=Roseospira marina TaxID=140057 RepID=A0A5M6IA42_9PROT|nr:SDR family NAD(P)-dependent oxidoreductase [Roseospira marina]KAA5604817.1 SDR family NAD(P)-dependent oxidoreductase [Roseospira marina]MBB4313508.1 NAD(P)-dependent dehydrogenase (short-subunit alcohol dehydrogenase family) [Roseospira marina]MBB5086670.1 NAD(P)-dependent dehydrogenase (short-subunit alcohol dehydrogenase family) [Roseospira marina]